jgi:hypothetical protein
MLGSFLGTFHLRPHSLLFNAGGPLLWAFYRFTNSKTRQSTARSCTGSSATIKSSIELFAILNGLWATRKVIAGWSDIMGAILLRRLTKTARPRLASEVGDQSMDDEQT